MTKSTPATFQAGKVIAMHQAKKDVAGGLMFFVGLGLCFTIVGAIVGIPLIIASFKASKSDPGVYGGSCPACSSEIYVSPQLEAFDCPTCKSRIIRRGEEFIWFTPNEGIHAS